MPWNFPFWQVFRFLAPALMAGNVGLLKHAPNVPQCALAIESLVRRAGFPRGTFQALLLEAHQVETVLGDERIAAVTVTGSEAAGRAIGAQAGWLIKKSVLELGGSDPFIVMPSADLDLAIETAVRARCVNSGQSCIAAKRFIVADAIYDEFESRFVAGMEAMRVGDPMKDTTDIGPLATARAVDTARSASPGGQPASVRASSPVASAWSAKATTSSPPFSPAFRAPQLSTAKSSSAPSPCSSACRISTRPSRSPTTRPSASAPLPGRATPPSSSASSLSSQCGGVFLNTMVASDPRLPFGGIKRSGYGRELSAAGMREFLNAKTVVIASAGSSTTTPASPICSPRPTHPSTTSLASTRNPSFRLSYGVPAKRSWPVSQTSRTRHIFAIEGSHARSQVLHRLRQ